MCIYLPFPADDAYFYHFGDTGRPNLRRETVIAGVRNRAGAVAIKAQAAHGGGQCRTIIGPGRLSHAAQLTGMLASFITLPQTTMSFVIWFANAADVLPTGWKLNLSSVALKSGSCTIAAICFCRSAMISGGVPAGATMPLIKSASWSGMPDSRKVGICGKAGVRSGLVTASARNFSELRYGAIGGSARKMIWVSPAKVALTAGVAPLNGTRTRPSSLSASLNRRSEVNWPKPMPIAA